jgi:hypothetical protein
VPSSPQAIEEHDDYQPLGVERESIDASAVFEEIRQPWDPESIRVSTKTFSLRNILDLIDEGSLDLAPDFQRLQVWKPRQKALLIESILLQIPLPAFYFAEDTDGRMRVVDGLQRLSTVRDFVRSGEEPGFRLRQLEYLSDVDGLRFDDLPAPWKRRIHNTQIVVHVIDPTTPAPVKFDIFRRINTGGTPLNAQEIRHCMSKTRSREFLKTAASSVEFRTATGDALARQKRMIDREVVLRFTAFSLLDSIAEYRVRGPMEQLLWTTTERLDDPSDISDAQVEILLEKLRHGLVAAEAVFGSHAFRKWPLHDDGTKPFNRALFESWTLVLSRAEHHAISRAASEIAQRARGRMTSDARYLDAITASTGDPRRVEYRFNVAAEIVAEETNA